MTLLLLWEEYGPNTRRVTATAGSANRYRAWRGTISPTMRQTHGPAEKLFVNSAGDMVVVFDATTGMERCAHIFVAVLGASNYTYAEARWSKGLADWIGVHVNALNAIGGAEGDWGLAPMLAEQRRDLLEIIEDRRGRGSTIVTSQLPVEHWHEIIGDPTIADAILDRLVHNAHRLTLKGESLRKAAAKRQKLDGETAN